LIPVWRDVIGWMSSSSRFTPLGEAELITP
jgi:hypothetical protein